MNKKISTPLGIILIVLAALLVGILAWQCWLVPEYGVPPIRISKPGKQVTITTDKTEDEQGEKVKIRLENKSDKSIWYCQWSEFSCADAFFLEKKNGKFKYFNIPGLRKTPTQPVELKPNLERIYQLSLNKLKEQCKDFSPKFSAGVYRLGFYYSFKQGKSYDRTIYSNEFTIKEKELTKTWKDWASIESKEECESYDGRWSIWSFWQGGKEECDMPYPDGGKVCKDPSDCESNLCLYDTEEMYNLPLVGQSAEGYCAYWISTSCVNHHYFIENGKIVEDMCIE